MSICGCTAFEPLPIDAPAPQIDFSVGTAPTNTVLFTPSPEIMTIAVLRRPEDDEQFSPKANRPSS
jgi:hypothetical protein